MLLMFRKTFIMEKTLNVQPERLSEKTPKGEAIV